MHIRFSTIVMTILTILAGCSTPDPTEVMVKDYLAQSKGLDNIEIMELQEPQPWRGADSLQLLKAEFEMQKEEQMGHLQKAIESSKKAIEQANEAKEGGFTALDAMIDETIETSQQQIEEAEALMAALNSDCKGTSLESLYGEIEHYVSVKDSVLWYRIEGKFTGGNAQEPEAFQLMSNKNKTKILKDLGS